MTKWIYNSCKQRLGAACLIILMNTMNTPAQGPVSYQTVRIDNLNIFYREAGPKDAPVLLLLHGVPTDTWTDEFYFLNRPGQADIQTDLFFDYQNNLKAYPTWQKWLRDHQPPMLVLWGRYDPSFLVEGAEAYRKDVPSADVHILDAGHFALDEQAPEVIRLTDAFMQKRTRH